MKNERRHGSYFLSYILRIRLALAYDRKDFCRLTRLSRLIDRQQKRMLPFGEEMQVLFLQNSKT